jgi:hypothetical protein
MCLTVVSSVRLTIACNSRAGSTEDAVRRGQRQVEQVKIKMGMQMDDKTFQTSLLETQVDFAALPWELRLTKSVAGHAHQGLYKVEL